ncbi:MAG TPA: MmcQ/YjbR family DNA-binding protein [Chloroflexota bacterium]|nr:MmcQ/YjbR family DNA-binding protein [Chloroflexota bacterium]HUM67525.1 MmcQ/YjbR family DNA-binding protein [Chloroflexota bacterium]
MKAELSEKQLARVRHICTTLPETMEKLSHGEPTFFVRKRVFAMFANNHHGDGRIAVWLPAPPGIQEMLITSSPETYFKPPYVGARGWIGIELAYISDEDLVFHIRDGWGLVAPKRLQAAVDNSAVGPKPLA